MAKKYYARVCCKTKYENIDECYRLDVKVHNSKVIENSLTKLFTDLKKKSPEFKYTLMEVFETA